VTEEDHSSNPPTEATASLAVDLGLALNISLADLSLEEQEAIASLPSGSALLIVKRGPNIGARFLLDKEESVAGRHPEADIFLDDVTVSRKHAKFERVDKDFYVSDLGSLNGTYLQGERIAVITKLYSGVEVQVGKFKLTFFASPTDIVNEA
jgi:pSer/pThr/pTyr-binding forkhead associated (FHA) protein